MNNIILNLFIFPLLGGIIGSLIFTPHNECAFKEFSKIFRHTLYFSIPAILIFLLLTLFNI